MSRTTVGFLLSALIWLVVGGLIGYAMAADQSLIYVLRDVHAHVLLVGFVSLMIFGVAYHILPRFSGRPLFSDGLAAAHLWMADIGLIGMSVGMGPLSDTGWRYWTLAIFGGVQFLGFLFFAFNLLRTVLPMPAPGPSPAMAQAMARTQARRGGGEPEPK